MVFAYLCDIVFIVNKCRMSQPTVDSVISVPVDQAFIKTAEQAMENKPKKVFPCGLCISS